MILREMRRKRQQLTEVDKKEYKAMCMAKIQIEHMAGKEANELINAQ